jgi:hypothetical protein
MSKQSAEAFVLLEQIINDNHKVSIEIRGGSSLQYPRYFELTIFRSISNDDHSHYQGETFIDVIQVAAKAEKLI